jgi:protein-tyrosine phosphatase
MLDATSGLCDLHCHLLYGLDDGARTLEDSLEMARLLVDLGFSTAAPSPHHRPEYPGKEVALARLADVQSELQAAAVPLALEPNAENFLLDDRFVNEIGTERGRPLGKGGYVLVEAPYSAPVPALADVIFRIRLKGVTPVFAHPERCYEFERKGRAAETVRAGAFLQLDVGALVGRYGSKSKKLACSFLDDGLYAIAATDLHSPRGAADWLDRSLAELRRRTGDQAFNALMRRNPFQMLAGQSLG